MWLLFIIIALVALIYLYIKNHYEYWKQRGIPYPEPNYISGNTTGRIFWDMKTMYNNFKKNKPFFGCFLLARPTLVITDLDFVRTITIRDFDYFHDRGAYHNIKDDPLTGHLINLEGEQWKNVRSKLTPTFSSGKMKYMFPTVVDLGYRLMNTLNEIINNQKTDVEIKDLMSRYTIDVIGTCAFGIECNSLKDPKSEFCVIGNEIFNKQRGNILSRFLRSYFHGLARLCHVKAHDNYMIDFFKNLVKDTIEYREKNNVKRKDFMDLLIDLKNSANGITFNEILGQCYVFFGAGYETSSSTMSYTLYEMAQNLDIQEKVRKEIDEVLTKHNGEFNYEALGEMVYLDQVINESLRLHSPVPCVYRIATKDYYIPELNFTIEKNTRIALPYGEYHLDSDYFPKPDTFDPDRFTPEAIKSRHPMAYLPFGDGPRNCIGLRFGKMESKIGLAILLKKFKFTNGSKTKVPLELNWKSFVVLQPKNFWLNVEKI